MRPEMLTTTPRTSGYAPLVPSRLRVLRGFLGLLTPAESLHALSEWRRHYVVAPAAVR